MTERIFDYMFSYGYEKVLLFQNEDVGWRGSGYLLAKRFV